MNVDNPAHSLVDRKLIVSFLFVFNKVASLLTRGAFILRRAQEWGYSSAGRAPALQAGSHRFEPDYLHHTWAHSSAG